MEVKEQHEPETREALEATGSITEWDKLPLVLETKDVARILLSKDDELACATICRLVRQKHLVPIPGFRKPFKFYREAVRGKMESTCGAKKICL